MGGLFEKEATHAMTKPINDESGDGWDQDEMDMARMGKKQEFQRTFNWVSSIGFTSCTMDKSSALEQCILETNLYLHARDMSLIPCSHRCRC